MQMQQIDASRFHFRPGFISQATATYGDAGINQTPQDPLPQEGVPLLGIFGAQLRGVPDTRVGATFTGDVTTPLDRGTDFPVGNWAFVQLVNPYVHTTQ